MGRHQIHSLLCSGDQYAAATFVRDVGNTACESLLAREPYYASSAGRMQHGEHSGGWSGQPCRRSVWLQESVCNRWSHYSDSVGGQSFTHDQRPGGTCRGHDGRVEKKQLAIGQKRGRTQNLPPALGIPLSRGLRISGTMASLTFPTIGS